MTINEAFAALHAELVADDVPDALRQPLTFGLVWLDLCRLAGEEPPAAVVALLDQPLDAAAIAAD